MLFLNVALIVRYQIIDLARSFRVYDRFIVLNVVQFFFLLRFDVALKVSRRIFFIAIDAFLIIVYRFAFVEEMFMCAKLAFYVIAINFVDVFVFLTMKTLLNFTFFSKYSKIFFQSAIWPQSICSIELLVRP